MRAKILAGVLLLWHSLLFATCQVTDDMGKQLQFNHPAQRIISLAPDITENLFALGAQQQIVGVIAGSHYPEAARNKTIVGSYTGLDLEKIITLQPDLVIVWHSAFLRQTLTLERLHIPVYVVNIVSLEDLKQTWLKFGCLTGHANRASKLSKEFTDQLMLIQKKYAVEKKKRVFFQVGGYSLITINRESWINQAIDWCGGKNIFAEVKTISPEVGWEAIIAADPEVVFSDAENEWQSRWRQKSVISAVKNHQLYSLLPDTIDRAGPRLIAGIKQICEKLR